ncbi:type I-E CRISPR-associated protein Cse1/CasA [Streptomyces sp. NPDC001985]|uniref:type I-E CRISPR-associated protein Cse1/CasA n=1 Tax=Streptomyces sp. NPDC001985 TaxID=3154406 RepID=UPI003323B238
MALAEKRPSPEGGSRPRWDPRGSPCVPVRTSAGGTRTLSLTDALRLADPVPGPGPDPDAGPGPAPPAGSGEYALAVSGATPGETVALLEYLLAICYRSGCCPGSDAEWRVWVRDAHPLTRAADWLAQERDEHWDLFHPTEPLGQNALLAPYLDERGAGPAQLVIEHAGDYNQFFDHHHLEHPVPLAADAAFRAMLTQHAYGPGGRARISGKDTLGPALTNLAAGRLAGRVRVLALGTSLGDTLRLNLAPTDSRPAGGAASDHFNRTWTVSPQPRREFRAKPPGRPVDGPADLHTLLGRSILMRPAVTAGGEPVLAGNGQPAVDRVLLAAGELLAPLPGHWTQDAVFTTTSTGTRKPLWPSPSKALWREAHALYAAVADRDPVGPRTGLWDRLAEMPHRPVQLWAVGLLAKQTTAISWVADTFPFIPGREAHLRQAAERGSLIADHLAACLYRAARAAWKVTYPRSKPADEKDQIARFDARPEHWAHTAEPFHALLDDTATAGGEARVHTALRVYAATLALAADRFLHHRLESLPANSRGFRARSAALGALRAGLTAPGAPDELKEEPA